MLSTFASLSVNSAKHLIRSFVALRMTGLAMNIKKALILTVICFLMSAGTAFAHITVNPRTAEPGYGVATIRVPNEKDNPTISVRVVVPEGATVHGVKAVPGWTYTVQRAEAVATPAEGHAESEGRITEVIWTGGQVGAGEFEEFPLSVQYGDPGDYVWKSYQTYSDGETVQWDGKDSDHPASVVAVAEAVDPAPEPTPPIVPQNQWLSILALLVALAALFISLRKK